MNSHLLGRWRLGVGVLAVWATAAGVLVGGGCGPAAATTVAAGSGPPGAVADCLLPPASCYAPHQFRAAYGVQSLLDRGTDGRGTTVSVLVPLPSPAASAPAATDIRQDLATFDRVFHLPAAPLHVVTRLAGSASPWRATIEEAQDTEIVHAIAPAAALRVVLMPATVLDSAANATADMLAGLRLAASHTDVASISWSLGEHIFTPAQVTAMNSVLRRAAAHRVTVIASSGDHGAASDPWFGGDPVKETSLPAANPLVLAVGGTTLTARLTARLTASRPAGAYLGETTWNNGHGASGGGFSRLYRRPRYQAGVAGTGRTRGVPDVAGDADPKTGMALAVNDGGHKYILGGASGTSASAPLWAGLLALADQYAHHSLGAVDPTIYHLARGPRSPHGAFHDVTTGDNTLTVGPAAVSGYPAAPGWDPVTGWGTPNARVLVPLLAHPTSRRE